MREQAWGNLTTGWWELVGEWGTLGQGYHCACLGILYNFGAEVNLSLTQTSRQSRVLALQKHWDPSP